MYVSKKKKKKKRKKKGILNKVANIHVPKNENETGNIKGRSSFYRRLSSRLHIRQDLSSVSFIGIISVFHCPFMFAIYTFLCNNIFQQQILCSFSVIYLKISNDLYGTIRIRKELRFSSCNTFGYYTLKNIYCV